MLINGLLLFGSKSEILNLICSNLYRDNVSWQSTCNGVGQTAGIVTGNVLFIVLESAKFSNEYFRPILHLTPQDHGLITIKSKIALYISISL
jgi:hypothetical protein